MYNVEQKLVKICPLLSLLFFFPNQLSSSGSPAESDAFRGQQQPSAHTSGLVVVVKTQLHVQELQGCVQQQALLSAMAVEVAVLGEESTHRPSLPVLNATGSL